MPAGCPLMGLADFVPESRHSTRRRFLVPLGDHQHHESHRRFSFWFGAELPAGVDRLTRALPTRRLTRREIDTADEIFFATCAADRIAQCSTITIHDTPKRSATMPKLGEKNVLESGIRT